MEISLLDLRRIITSAAEIGVANYMKAREPESDLLKQADAKRYTLKKYFGKTQDVSNKFHNFAYITNKHNGYCFHNF